MVSVGVVDDKLNQGYDILSTVLLIINLATAFAMTFEDFYKAHYQLLHWTEAVHLGQTVSAQEQAGCSHFVYFLRLRDHRPSVIPAVLPAGILSGRSSSVQNAQSSQDLQAVQDQCVL